MFIENNLRKKKPEGTFTDPDKQEAKEVSFIYNTPITSPVVYSSTTVRKTPVRPVVTVAPAPQPIIERYTKGGFGAIR